MFRIGSGLVALVVGLAPLPALAQPEDDLSPAEAWLQSVLSTSAEGAVDVGQIVGLRGVLAYATEHGESAVNPSSLEIACALAKLESAGQEDADSSEIDELFVCSHDELRKSWKGASTPESLGAALVESIVALERLRQWGSWLYELSGELVEMPIVSGASPASSAANGASAWSQRLTEEQANVLDAMGFLAQVVALQIDSGGVLQAAGGSEASSCSCQDSVRINEPACSCYRFLETEEGSLDSCLASDVGSAIEASWRELRGRLSKSLIDPSVLQRTRPQAAGLAELFAPPLPSRDDAVQWRSFLHRVKRISSRYEDERAGLLLHWLRATESEQRKSACVAWIDQATREKAIEVPSLDLGECLHATDLLASIAGRTTGDFSPLDRAQLSTFAADQESMSEALDSDLDRLSEAGRSSSRQQLDLLLAELKRLQFQARRLVAVVRGDGGELALTEVSLEKSKLGDLATRLAGLATGWDGLDYLQIAESLNAPSAANVGSDTGEEGLDVVERLSALTCREETSDEAPAQPRADEHSPPGAGCSSEWWALVEAVRSEIETVDKELRVKRASEAFALVERFAELASGFELEIGSAKLRLSLAEVLSSERGLVPVFELAVAVSRPTNGAGVSDEVSRWWDLGARWTAEPIRCAGSSEHTMVSWQSCLEEWTAVVKQGPAQVVEFSTEAARRVLSALGLPAGVAQNATATVWLEPAPLAVGVRILDSCTRVVLSSDEGDSPGAGGTEGCEALDASAITGGSEQALALWATAAARQTVEWMLEDAEARAALPPFLGESKPQFAAPQAQVKWSDRGLSVTVPLGGLVAGLDHSSLRCQLTAFGPGGLNSSILAQACTAELGEDLVGLLSAQLPVVVEQPRCSSETMALGWLRIPRKCTGKLSLLDRSSSRTEQIGAIEVEVRAASDWSMSFSDGGATLSLGPVELDLATARIALGSEGLLLEDVQLTVPWSSGSVAGSLHLTRSGVEISGGREQLQVMIEGLLPEQYVLGGLSVERVEWGDGGLRAAWSASDPAYRPCADRLSAVVLDDPLPTSRLLETLASCGDGTSGRVAQLLAGTYTGDLDWIPYTVELGSFGSARISCEGGVEFCNIRLTSEELPCGSVAWSVRDGEPSDEPCLRDFVRSLVPLPATASARVEWSAPDRGFWLRFSEPTAALFLGLDGKMQLRPPSVDDLVAYLQGEAVALVSGEYSLGALLVTVAAESSPPGIVLHHPALPCAEGLPLRIVAEGSDPKLLLASNNCVDRLLAGVLPATLKGNDVKVSAGPEGIVVSASVLDVPLSARFLWSGKLEWDSASLARVAASAAAREAGLDRAALDSLRDRVADLERRFGIRAELHEVAGGFELRLCTAGRPEEALCIDRIRASPDLLAGGDSPFLDFSRARLDGDRARRFFCQKLGLDRECAASARNGISRILFEPQPSGFRLAVSGTLDLPILETSAPFQAVLKCDLASGGACAPKGSAIELEAAVMDAVVGELDRLAQKESLNADAGMFTLLPKTVGRSGRDLVIEGSARIDAIDALVGELGFKLVVPVLRQGKPRLDVTGFDLPTNLAELAGDLGFSLDPGVLQLESYSFVDRHGSPVSLSNLASPPGLLVQATAHLGVIKFSLPPLLINERGVNAQGLRQISFELGAAIQIPPYFELRDVGGALSEEELRLGASLSLIGLHDIVKLDGSLGFQLKYPLQWSGRGDLVVFGTLPLGYTEASVDLERFRFDSRFELGGVLSDIILIEGTLALDERGIRGGGSAKLFRIEVSQVEFAIASNGEVKIRGMAKLLDDWGPVAAFQFETRRGFSDPRLLAELSLRLAGFTLSNARLRLDPAVADLSFRVLGIPMGVVVPLDMSLEDAVRKLLENLIRNLSPEQLLKALKAILSGNFQLNPFESFGPEAGAGGVSGGDDGGSAGGASGEGGGARGVGGSRPGVAGDGSASPRMAGSLQGLGNALAAGLMGGGGGIAESKGEAVTDAASKRPSQQDHGGFGNESCRSNLEYGADRSTVYWSCVSPSANDEAVAPTLFGPFPCGELFDCSGPRPRRVGGRRWILWYGALAHSELVGQELKIFTQRGNVYSVDVGALGGDLYPALGERVAWFVEPLLERLAWDGQLEGVAKLRLDRAGDVLLVEGGGLRTAFSPLLIAGEKRVAPRFLEYRGDVAALGTAGAQALLEELEGDWLTLVKLEGRGTMAFWASGQGAEGKNGALGWIDDRSRKGSFEWRLEGSGSAPLELAPEMLRRCLPAATEGERLLLVGSGSVELIHRASDGKVCS